MRFLLIAASFFVFSFCSERRTLPAKLRHYKWFAHAENWERDHSAILNKDSTGKYDWSMVLDTGDRMLYSSFINQPYIDSAGIFHPKGEKFSDTTYSYTFKNNVLKVTKEFSSYYLMFIPQNDSQYQILASDEAAYEKLGSD